jgi:hypothetical protein
MARDRDAARYLHTEVKRNAKRREIPHSLTLADVEQLVAKAGGRCQVTGIVFSNEIVNGTRPYGPSLDRIDSSEGYHPDNVRLVCIAINNAMRDWGDSVFFTLVNALLSKLLESLDVEEERPPGRPGEVG